MQFRDRNQITDFEVKLGLTRPEFAFDPACRLTVNEEIVARLLCYGRTNPQIGVIIGISTKHARNYVETVMQKLAADSRHDVMLKARRVTEI